MVSTRDGSASSCRPEKASTREDRSSIVTGASMSAATAFATENRSPGGSPPRVSCPSSPMSPSESRERSSAASWVQDAPLVSPSSGTPEASTAAVTSADSGAGERSTRPAASCLPRTASRSAASCADRMPPPRAGPPPGQDRLVHRVVDGDAADLVDRVGVAADELEQRPAEVVEHPAQAGLWPHLHCRHDTRRLLTTCHKSSHVRRLTRVTRAGLVGFVEGADGPG